MKIYFRNEAAKLTQSKGYSLSCKRCPFHRNTLCFFGTGTILDCNCKGWWVNEELLDIFKI